MTRLVLCNVDGEDGGVHSWPRKRANINRPGACLCQPAQVAPGHLSTMDMFDKLCSFENLYAAYRAAIKGKRGRWQAAEFEHDLEDNLLILQDELRAGDYSPGAYHSFYIHEPKRRLISAAPFRDRVVHHALCNVIEPLLERTFVFDSYANRVGKGTHRALDRCQCFARRYRYCLQIDLEQFFPSIDHAILLGMLGTKIKDSRVLALTCQILASGEGVLSEAYDMRHFPGDDLFAASRPRGLPIGNLTSQFLANVYLTPFDHFVTRGLSCGAFIRYVDDALMFSDDKCELNNWLVAIHERLDRYRLTAHAGAHPQPVAEGIPFLGFVIFPQQRRLKRRKGVHFARTLKMLYRQYANGDIEMDTLNASVQGWTNHVRYANTLGLRDAVLARPVPKRITGTKITREHKQIQED